MFRIQGIPAVKAFRDGRVVAEFVGARSPAGVAAFVDELLAPPQVSGIVDELRASGELPDVLDALEAGTRSARSTCSSTRFPGRRPSAGSAYARSPSRSSTISGTTTR